MKRTKRQLIDLGLFLYGGIVSFVLTGHAIFNLNSASSVITLVLFMPIFIYFLVRMFESGISLVGNALNTNIKRHPYFGNFSMGIFINQSETGFLVNLFLIVLATSLILFRISLNIIK